jgi:hypothetical protein
MTSAFRDLDEFLVTRPIRLPIGGVQYEFPGSLPGKHGLLLQRMQAAAVRAVADGRAQEDVSDLATAILSDDEGEDLRTTVMGTGEQAMVDAGVTSDKIEHTFHTLLAWHMAGEAAALLIWESVPGEAPAPNRAARRAASKGAASSTRSPASSSGTSTRTPANRKASSGARSLSTGGSSRRSSSTAAST